jgi:membrane-associated phospholipid phosphatase
MDTFSYPVWFTESGTNFKDRVYCYHNDITQCATDKTSTAPCCGFLKDGKQPGEAVSTTNMVLISILVPTAIVLISCALSVCSGRFGYRWEHAAAELNTATFGFLLNGGCMLLIMDLFKKVIGCPRPNWNALGAMHDYDNNIYAKWEHDRFANVPSGHTSTAVSFTLYVSFYLNAKLEAYLPLSDTSATGDSIRLFAQIGCYLPTILGLWIAATRLQDFWHSNAAVALGTLLGGVCASFSWQRSGAYYFSGIWANRQKPLDDTLPVSSTEFESALKGS